jgi:hypothetical protein
MNMPRFRLALTLAAQAGTIGVPEELVGDVLEEVERGRSRLWLWQQLLGLCWFAFLSRLRTLRRPGPVALACAMSAILFLAGSIAPPRAVVAAWLVFYYLMGALSLFTQMAAHTMGMNVSAISDTDTADRPSGVSSFRG